MRTWHASSNMPATAFLPRCVNEAITEAKRCKLSTFEISLPVDKGAFRLGIRMYLGAVGKDIDLSQGEDAVRREILAFVQAHSL